MGFPRPARSGGDLYDLINFNDEAEADARALESYAAFRREARTAAVRHFLQVFNPNLAGAVTPEQTGAFVSDCIIRLLASLTPSERTEFLKVAYNGPDHLAALTAHDPTMVVGVLGGVGSTHRDTFELIQQSERQGARLALFGRKINQAEVAKRSNLSRPTVITELRLAPEHQIVGVKIAGVHFRVNDLADALCETYCLQSAYVVPEAGSAVQTTYHVCEAAAQFPPDFASSGNTLMVSWGQTVSFVSERMPWWPVQRLVVRQLIGSPANPLLPTCES